MQEPRQKSPGGPDDQDQRKQRLRHSPDNRNKRAFPRLTQDGEQQHHWHDAKILKEQDTARQAALDRIDLPPIIVNPQHDRGAAQGQQESVEDSNFNRKTEETSEGQDEEYR